MNQSTVRNIMIRTKTKGLSAFLLHVMADHDGGAPHYCWASAATLAAQCNMTRRAVIKHRKQLVAMGEIEPVGSRKVRTAGGVQRVTCFRICVERILQYPSRLEGGVICSPPRKGGAVCSPPQGGVKRSPPSGKGVSSVHPKDSVHTEAVVPTASVEHYGAAAGKNFAEDHAHEEWLKNQRGEK